LRAGRAAQVDPVADLAALVLRVNRLTADRDDLLPLEMPPVIVMPLPSPIGENGISKPISPENRA